VRIVWKENVRQWHPGQRWIFEAGGMGVFDPGVNALSIVTCLIRDPIIVERAALHVPVNCAQPIQVQMDMRTGPGLVLTADFDFLQTGLQTWDITIETASGDVLGLRLGGAELVINGAEQVKAKEAEYPGLYARFRELVQKRASDVDVAPLRLVADAALIGARIPAPEFIE
jgi:D-galactose 1-dehydrogenase